MSTNKWDKLWRNVQPLYDLHWPFWDQIWNCQGLSFLQTPKNWKLVHIWRSYSPKCKIRLNLLRQVFWHFFKKEKKFGRLHSLSMALFGLFETRFEILRVLAFCRPQKIENWSIFEEATAQNVKFVKNSFGRFFDILKKKKQSSAVCTAFLWPYLAFLRPDLKFSGS